MVVRSLNSSVLVWPSRDEVLSAARTYAEKLVATDERVSRVALIGSYATGEQGPGSDADLLVVLSRSDVPAPVRALQVAPPHLPVHSDVLVLTEAELGEWSLTRPRWSREVLGRAVTLAARPVSQCSHT